MIVRPGDSVASMTLMEAVGSSSVTSSTYILILLQIVLTVLLSIFLLSASVTLL